jgi:transposase InsO family protein
VRRWVRQAEADQGKRADLLTSDERERLKAYEREVKELRRANKILESAWFFRCRARPAPSKSAASASGSSRSRERDSGCQAQRQTWLTTTPDPAGQRKPNLVERDFTAERPNTPWVADFTHLRTWEVVPSAS